ncbi:guanylate kinase [Clostridium sp. LIBA-8841]|uniref:guanylate kinase n=1 Tax=Clostridium sp. LIBA-8841 TaxID=2987530 RepID=UPI002AC45044|nr:guanylate kinase [Clostridium sp. LIBA-8841]MDZ5254895.1 guanylate kinase [Clostridium sp. LIBA-8841]
MGKIFCIMGKSGSGKDTILKEINKIEDLNLKTIVTYTTRPKRNNETDGVEYFFIDKKKLDSFDKEGKIIECRVYDTVHGKWYYSTIDDGQIDLENNNYIVIVTLEAYSEFRKYFSDEKLIPLYINLDDGIRLERALKREREQKNPNYNEMCRRFLADNEDFSEDKLISNNIIKKYDNYDLNKCINDISEVIRKLSK